MDEDQGGGREAGRGIVIPIREAGRGIVIPIREAGRGRRDDETGKRDHKEMGGVGRKLVTFAYFDSD